MAAAPGLTTQNKATSVGNSGTSSIPPMISESETGTQNCGCGTRTASAKTNANNPEITQQNTQLASTPYHFTQAVLVQPQDAFAKQWDLRFSVHQHPKDQPFIERRRQAFEKDGEGDSQQQQRSTNDEDDSDRNGISIFLRDYDHSMGLVQVDRVEDFCRNVSLKDLSNGTGAAGFRRAAWLDDRQFSDENKGGKVRVHQNPATATSLYRDLGKLVTYTHLNLVDTTMLTTFL